MSETLTAAGVPLPNADVDIRRYCGLTGEVWAYRYFDAVTTTADDVTPVDVLAAAALHPSLNPSDLAWFVHRKRDLFAWLQAVSPQDSLEAADEQLLLHVRDGLTDLVAQEQEAVGLSLLTKVIHRKRPRLVPIFDRRVWRPYVRASNGANEDAWSLLLSGMKRDLSSPSNEVALERLQTSLVGELEGQVLPTRLRMLDIALWMEGGREQ